MKKQMVKAVIFAAAALAVLVPMAAYPLTLAEGGRATATIVLSENPSPAELTAASELSDYLKKITEATFTIAEAQAAVTGSRILVGDGKVSRQLLGKEWVTALRPDNFIVKVAAQDLCWSVAARAGRCTRSVRSWRTIWDVAG